MLTFRCCLFLLALALTGCGPDKLKATYSVNLAGEESVKQFTLDAQSAAQSLKVDVAMDNPVCVYVMQAKDAPPLDNFDVKGKWSEKAIASKKEIVKEVLTASIPAKTGVVVIVALGKSEKASGTVKLTN